MVARHGSAAVLAHADEHRVTYTRFSCKLQCNGCSACIKAHTAARIKRGICRGSAVGCVHSLHSDFKSEFASAGTGTPGMVRMEVRMHSMHTCGHGMGTVGRATSERYDRFGMRRGYVWTASTQPKCMHAAKTYHASSAKLQCTVCQQNCLVLSKHVELLDHFLGAINAMPRNAQVATSPWRHSSACL